MNIPTNLIHALRQAQKVAALTGAGISKESGIPTFREAQTGLWAKYDPQQLATPQAFQRDPRLVWEWYQWRRALIAQAEPNPGHRALALLAGLVPKFTLITQNVDGLHRLAGSPQVIELHGDITRTKCSECGQIARDRIEQDNPLPRCPACNGLLRPDVVWFGESLPGDALEAAFQAARQADVFLSIGTSALVEPAASLPMIALQAGAVLVEINPETTPISQLSHYTLSGPSGQILPHLIRQAWPEKEN